MLAAVLLLAAVAYVAWSERAVPTTGPVDAPAAARPSSAPIEPRTPAAAPAPTATTAAAATVAKRSATPSPPPAIVGMVMRQQRIYDESGRLVHEGDVDLAPVFARIAAGERDSHRNDGTVFGNREGRLPRAARGYYTEWVVRTEGLRGVGPQRLITGQKGEAYYTPDHYETFIPVRRPS